MVTDHDITKGFLYWDRFAAAFVFVLILLWRPGTLVLKRNPRLFAHSVCLIFLLIQPVFFPVSCVKFVNTDTVTNS